MVGLCAKSWNKVKSRYTARYRAFYDRSFIKAASREHLWLYVKYLLQYCHGLISQRIKYSVYQVWLLRWWLVCTGIRIGMEVTGDSKRYLRGHQLNMMTIVYKLGWRLYATQQMAMLSASWWSTQVWAKTLPLTQEHELNHQRIIN